MKHFPTTNRIFNVDSLGEEVPEYIKSAYIENCIKECIENAIEPYEKELNCEGFNFEEGKMELFGSPGGYFFDDEDSVVPVNTFMSCDSFIKLRGTKYEKLLVSKHIIKPSEEEQDYLDPIGLELEYAEHHLDCNWEFYSDIDDKSYRRVVNCYQEAADDGNLNALWCLGCAFGRMRSYIDEESYGLSYYYLSTAINKGHITSIPSFCERLSLDGFHKNVFILTLIGAQKNELFSMWNLARYYLCGVIVPKNESRAVELYESILDILKAQDKSSSELICKYYDGINAEDFRELKQYVKHNLKVIKSNNTSWHKYFDMEILKKFDEARKQVMKESMELTDVSTDWVNNRIKELMK